MVFSREIGVGIDNAIFQKKKKKMLLLHFQHIFFKIFLNKFEGNSAGLSRLKKSGKIRNPGNYRAFLGYYYDICNEFLSK